MHAVCRSTRFLKVAQTRVYSVQKQKRMLNACRSFGHDRSRYQPDGEGMTVFDRSRCREGAGWIETNEGRSEFHKVCKRLDQAKDEVKGENNLTTSFALWFSLYCRISPPCFSFTRSIDDLACHAEKKIMETEVAQLFYEHLDKTE